MIKKSGFLKKVPYWEIKIGSIIHKITQSQSLCSFEMTQSTRFLLFQQNDSKLLLTQSRALKSGSLTLYYSLILLYYYLFGDNPAYIFSTAYMQNLAIITHAFQHRPKFYLKGCACRKFLFGGRRTLLLIIAIPDDYSLPFSLQ